MCEWHCANWHLPSPRLLGRGSQGEDADGALASRGITSEALLKLRSEQSKFKLRLEPD